MDIGVDDLILLEQIDQQSVLKMLQYRYSNDIIYTSIGNVIISLNPYKEIRDLYTKELALMYRQCEILKPHIYTLAQAAILDLNSWQRDQCVIISGESGAGKTEASKIFLSYIALQDTTSNTKQIENQLVLSNNILEAFGNAKTIRNDNSSRFGKYMDLRFSNNLAVGGHILAYLLEKSRVVNVGLGERNYHIFYLILSGLSPTQLETYSITSDPSKFRFLAKSGCYNTTINDKERFDSFISALRALGFTISDINDIYTTIAAILLLGNLDFSPVEKDAISTGRETCQVENKQLLKTIANHLNVNPSDLESALTFRSIKDNNKKIKNDILVPLSLNEADFSRNALAKATYMRLFNHVIDKINTSMQPSIKEKTNSIGVLDIFGFEVFEVCNTNIAKQF
jgi:myosin-1